MADARATIEKLGMLLKDAGYTLETPAAGAQLLAVRRARGAGPFLPFVDYVFVHETDGADAVELERRHADGRGHAESRFRLPRILRYRIPNVVTVAVTGEPPDAAAVDWVRQGRKLTLTGGIKESAYLLDLPGGRVVNAGLEETPMRYGGSAAMPNNPVNKAFMLLARIWPRLGLTLETTGE